MGITTCMLIGLKRQQRAEQGPIREALKDAGFVSILERTFCLPVLPKAEVAFLVELVLLIAGVAVSRLSPKIPGC